MHESINKTKMLHIQNFQTYKCFTNLWTTYSLEHKADRLTKNFLTFNQPAVHRLGGRRLCPVWRSWFPFRRTAGTCWGNSALRSPSSEAWRGGESQRCCNSFCSLVRWLFEISLMCWRWMLFADFLSLNKKSKVV